MRISDQFREVEIFYSEKGYDYDKSKNAARDKWISEKKYQQFYKYLEGVYERGYPEFSLPFLEALLIDNEFSIYRRYWRSCLRDIVKYFWDTYEYWDEGIGYKEDPKTLKYIQYNFDVELTTDKFLSCNKNILEENSKKYTRDQDNYMNFVWMWHETMEFIDKFIVAMQKINDITEIEKAKILKESIYTLKKVKPKKTTDKRKIDEYIFWELIKLCRNECEDNTDFLEQLQNKLEAFKAEEIRRFERIFLTKMNELYHWDIWALAYIVRGGCGDDAFDYFRAWVISQGENIFMAVKNMEIKELKEIFKEDEPQFEDMLSVSRDAYENKKSEMLPEVRVKSYGIQGVKWKEENVLGLYPNISKLFQP